MYSDNLLRSCVVEIPCLSNLFVDVLFHRFEDDGNATAPFVVTNIPLQPLELPKAQPYMTVGRCNNGEPLYFLTSDTDSPRVY